MAGMTLFDADQPAEQLGGARPFRVMPAARRRQVRWQPRTPY